MGAIGYAARLPSFMEISAGASGHGPAREYR